MFECVCVCVCFFNMEDNRKWHLLLMRGGCEHRWCHKSEAHMRCAVDVQLGSDTHSLCGQRKQFRCAADWFKVVVFSELV